MTEDAAPLEPGSATPGARFLPAPAALVTGLFFLSGLSSLMLEMVWMRRLVLVFGSTSFAVATVTAAFMGGLALGSYAFGRLADRWKAHVALYGLLEAAVGVYALLVPLVFAAAVPLYRTLWESLHLSYYPFSLVRFLLAALVLIVPTTLMGASLPVLSRHLVRSRERIGSGVGRLYAVNTAGAVCGTFLAGFVFLPALGEWRTLLLAAAVNFVIAVTAFALHLRGKGQRPARAGAALPPPPQPRPEPPPAWAEEGRRGLLAAVLVAFALSGFAAMTYQVGWTRYLSLIIGSSVYAFGVILTTFLAGIAAGSAVLSRSLPRIRRPVTALALCQLFLGLTALLPVFFPDFLFYLFARLFVSDSLFFLLAVEFLLVGTVIFLPTFLMGASFPVVVSIYNREVSRLGRRVGEIYTVNTLGSIAGSFAAGFLLIPFLGVHAALKIAVLVNLGLAAALALWVRRGSRRQRAAAVAASLAAACLALLAAPGPSPHVWSTGVFKNADLYGRCGSYREFRTLASDATRRVVFHEEGITTTVTVSKFPGQYSIAVNGKVDGSSVSDMETQSLSAHLPLLLARKSPRVLVVGYGTGVTAGVATLYTAKVTCIELEPAVVEAGRHFSHVNYDTEAQVKAGRLEIVENDGRNYLLASPETYDVIVSEPSNPWMSGSAKLFTREFFELARSRLNTGGVYAQWVQLYGMDRRNVQCLLHTFTEVFGPCLVFNTAFKADLLLIARHNGGMQVSWEALGRAFRNERARGDLWRLGILRRSDLTAYFLLDSPAVQRFLADHDGTLNTDDNSFIEFHAPRTLNVRGKKDAIYEAMVAAMSDPMDAFLVPDEERLPFLLAAGQHALALKRRKVAQRIEGFLGAHVSSEASERNFHALLRADIAASEGRWDDAVRALTAPPLEKRGLWGWPTSWQGERKLGRFHASRKAWADAIPCFDWALERNPNDGFSSYWRGVCRFHLKEYEKAVPDLRRAKDSGQAFPGLDYYLGASLLETGEKDRARAHLVEQVLTTPDHDRARAALVRAAGDHPLPEAVRDILSWRNNARRAEELFRQGDKILRTGGRPETGIDLLLRSLEEDGFDRKRYHKVARALLGRGDHDRAFTVFRKGIRAFPDDVKLHQGFAFHLEARALAADRAERGALLREAGEVLARVRVQRKNLLAQNEIRRRIERLIELIQGS